MKLKSVLSFIAVFIFGLLLGLNTAAHAQTTLTPEKPTKQMPEWVRRIVDFGLPAKKDPLAPYQIIEQTGEDKETVGDHREFEVRFAQSLGLKNAIRLKEASQEMKREGINLLAITSSGALLAIKPDAVDCFILQQSTKAAEILNRVLNKNYKLVLEVATGRDPDGKNYQLECERAF